jgi:hypothetical protein
MGLINFLSFNPIGKKITSGISVVGTILNHPIATLTQGFSKTQAQFEKESTTNPVGASIKTAVGYGTTALAVASLGSASGLVAGGSIASKVAGLGTTIVKTAVANPIKSLGAVVIGSAVLNSPKLQTQVSKTNPVSFGSDIGTLIENPSIENAKAVAVNNPVLTTATAVGGAVAIGGGLGLTANTIATYLNSKATKENTLSTSEPANSSNPSAVLPTATGGNSSINTNEGLPVTPATQTIQAGHKTRSKRSKIKAKPTGNINIKIDNRDVLNEFSGRKVYKHKVRKK